MGSPKNRRHGAGSGSRTAGKAGGGVRVMAGLAKIGRLAPSVAAEQGFIKDSNVNIIEYEEKNISWVRVDVSCPFANFSRFKSHTERSAAAMLLSYCLMEKGILPSDDESLSEIACVDLNTEWPAIRRRFERLKVLIFNEKNEEVRMPLIDSALETARAVSVRGQRAVGRRHSK